jgi:PAS domain-containing protein
MHTAHEMSEWSAPGLHASILDSVTANVAILNAEGEIVAVNDAWVRFAEFNALPVENHGLGLDYIAFCDGLGGPAPRKRPSACETCWRASRDLSVTSTRWISPTDRCGRE